MIPEGKTARYPQDFGIRRHIHKLHSRRDDNQHPRDTKGQLEFSGKITAWTIGTRKVCQRTESSEQE